MDQGNKKRETPEEIEKKCEDRLNKIIFKGNNLEDLVMSIDSMARKSMNEELKKKFILKFHQALSKFKVEELQKNVYEKLDEQDKNDGNERMMLFFDYMNYSFELLSKNVKLEKNEQSYSTAYLLKAFNTFIEFKGTYGIIKGISAKKSLVNSVITIS